MEISALKRRHFWRGVFVCLVIAVIVLGFVTCRQVKWYSSHSNPTDDELRKIAILLNLGHLDEVEVTRYEFMYEPYWMDKFGSSTSMIERTDKSPPWEAMLANWKKHDAFPSDFNRVHIQPWAGEQLDKEAPFYVRVVRTVSMREGSSDESKQVWWYPQVCVAYFDKDDPEKLFLLTEGELMMPQSAYLAEETSGVVDLSLPPWHSIDFYTE